MREKLPDTRSSVVHKFTIGEHEGFLIVGFYDDGRVGEIFINMTREGSTLGGAMDCIAALTSIALQSGTELKDLVHKFSHTRFEPSGHSNNKQIGYATSIPDYVFRWLAIHFVKDYEHPNEPQSISTQRLSQGS